MATRSEVFIPRLKYSVPAETVDIAILHAVQKLGYDRPTPEQAAAVREFLLGKDVFVSLTRCLPEVERVCVMLVYHSLSIICYAQP